jgi:N-acylglucosamine 2-epimerase
MDFKATAERYKRELLESVIPFWENNCLDTANGGYHTMLDRDGSVYDTEKYMWMQWRIVYMFATLATTDLPTPEEKKRWIQIASDGFDFLADKGQDENGQYYFVLSGEGEPAVAPYNIYTECFAAMGSAALFKAAGEEKYRQEALKCTDNYLARISNPKSQWNKELSGRPERLTFGHYMILANLADVMNQNLDTDVYEKDIENATNIVLDKFWNDDLKLLFENVNVDGRFDLNSSMGRHVMPGHGLEALWFLMQQAERNGQDEIISKCSTYAKHILEFGWDKKFGGLYYFMDALAKPHFELQADMKLWWVHNEAIIAALYGYKLTGDEELLNWFIKLDEWTWSHFPDSEYGEWFGYLNRSGEPSNFLKGGRWKTFFHLPRFLHVSYRQLINLSQHSTNESSH